MGHSMGGALSQWVLRYVTPDPSTGFQHGERETNRQPGGSGSLPAVVLVAPWVAHSSMADDMPTMLKMMAADPVGIAMMFYKFNADSWVRTPQAAAAKLLSPEAVVSPEELQRQLVGESALVIFQHNPPFWKPAENVKTPMLLLAGEKDAVLSVEALRKTALITARILWSSPARGTT
jgi:alpha-beta hydrolase superfamily lysophospholipase